MARFSGGWWTAAIRVRPCCSARAASAGFSAGCHHTPLLRVAATGSADSDVATSVANFAAAGAAGVDAVKVDAACGLFRSDLLSEFSPD